MSNKFKIGDLVESTLTDEKGIIFEINDHNIYKVCCNGDATDYHETEIKKTKEDNRSKMAKSRDLQQVFESFGYEYSESIDKARDIIFGNKTDPLHYKNQSIEVWEMMIRIWGKEKFISFCEMNAFKYRMRVGSKEGESIEDEIKKAQIYEQKANELRAENNLLTNKK